MRKSKYLIIILVISVMLMGAGYAMWSQSFSITAVAEAGEIRVEVDLADLGYDTQIESFDTIVDGVSTRQNQNGMGVIGTYNGDISKYTDWTEYLINHTYTDISILIPPNKEGATLLLTDAYPGMQAVMDFEMTNYSPYKVLISCDAAAEFDGIGELAQHLLDEDIITVEITPRSSSKPNGFVIENELLDRKGRFTVTVTVNETLEESYDINGTTYQVEAVNGQSYPIMFELPFTFTITD